MCDGSRIGASPAFGADVRVGRVDHANGGDRARGLHAHRGAGALALAFVGVGAAPAQPVGTEPVASVNRPLFVTSVPGDDSTLVVVEQRGVISLVRDGQVLPTPFLDIDALVVGGTSGSDERGLLGLAFAPDYQTSGTFYVNYTGGSSLTSFVVEYRRSTSNPDTADASSARGVLSYAQPFGNHNAGWMGFSPVDGYLYSATGDGGSGG